MSEFECPKCGAALSGELGAEIAAESRMTFCISVKAGEKIQAHTLGGTINSFADLIKAASKALDYRAEVLVDALRTKEDGTLEIDFLIARSPVGTKSGRKGRASA